MEYIPIRCKTAIRKVRGRFPYDYDLNIYRGCEHGCLYCYAVYSHRYLNDEKFYEHIYYKENILEVLEKELSSPHWKREKINLGSVCDSYQPCERELQLMRGVLKLMIKYRNPILISTKSKLILRDLDLIAELSALTDVHIVSTVTCADIFVQKIMEPYASISLERMKMLQMMKQHTQAHITILLMPIIPYINDSYENIEAIYELASQIGVEEIVPGVLYLRGPTKTYFLNKIKAYDKNLYQKIEYLYRKGSCDKAYKNQIYDCLSRVRQKYLL